MTTGVARRPYKRRAKRRPKTCAWILIIRHVLNNNFLRRLPTQKVCRSDSIGWWWTRLEDAQRPIFKPADTVFSPFLYLLAEFVLVRFPLVSDRKENRFTPWTPQQKQSTWLGPHHNNNNSNNSHQSRLLLPSRKIPRQPKKKKKIPGQQKRDTPGPSRLHNKRDSVAARFSD
jgi:hypothetical protein